MLSWMLPSAPRAMLQTGEALPWKQGQCFSKGAGGGGGGNERRRNVIVYNRTHLVAKASPAAVNTSTMEWSAKMLSWMLPSASRAMLPPVRLVSAVTGNVKLVLSMSEGYTICTADLSFTHARTVSCNLLLSLALGAHPHVHVSTGRQGCSWWYAMAQRILTHGWRRMLYSVPYV